MSRRTRVALVSGVALAIGLTLITAIAVIGPDRGLEGRARERELAAEFYQMRCAACHELEGGIGSPLPPRVLASYGTAQLLFNYVRLAMPYEAPRTLSNEEYWLTVGHLLRSRGLVVEDAVVNQETAEGIKLDGSAS
ncbi:MAG: cytochrome c [Gemmatimonadetes bacterium]|nr:cytochrome c [Gemmatimonadota bacterium]